MAYAEKVPSASGSYFRGRYRNPDGKYISVRDEDGDVIRYATRKEAKQGAEDKESDVRNHRWRDHMAGQITFSEWADTWYATFDLAASTMASRRRHLADHLIPFFGDKPLRKINAKMILEWEREEKSYRYKPSTIRTWRGTLHLILEDAVGTHIAVNPATRKRGRGKRSGRRTDDRGPEKVITDPLGVLLIAERMSILTGRDDEFVMVQTAFWEALRLGELVGLEKQHARPRKKRDTVRVESQLHEVEGELIRCPPKDDSYGNPDTPPFLRRLIDEYVREVSPRPCPCHGEICIFRGLGIPRPRWNQPVRLLASEAGVSETVAQSALGGRGRISEATRQRVLEMAARLGYERDETPGDPAWHWRRSAFEELFTAAASGWLPPRKPLPRRPVPLKGEWPGIRVHGRNAQGRAEFSWLPVAEGLTPHGLRHSWKTWAEEQRVPEILSESHMRHEIPGVSAVYRHVTGTMRAELVAAETRAWEEAIIARLAMSSSSPVAVLDRLLKECLEARKPRLVPRNSPGTAEAVPLVARDTASDLRRGDWI